MAEAARKKTTKRKYTRKIAAKKETPSSVKDKDNDFLGRGLYNPNELYKEGLLNPAVWDGTPNEDMPFSTISERIMTGLKELFDENASFGGRYTWRIGLFLEEEHGMRAGDGWVLLKPDMVRNWWNDDIQRRLGLIEWQGALCWPGRGIDEKHLVFVHREDTWLLKEEIRSRKAEEIIAHPKNLEDEVHRNRMSEPKFSSKDKKISVSRKADVD